MWNGVAGLKAHSTAMESVSDNISNVNTYGYKSTRSIFADIFSQELALGNGSNDQVGNGSQVGVENVMNQGSLEPTDNVLDMAVSGNGFFIIKPEIVGWPDLLYSRAGQFLLDVDGYLVNSQGYKVQGYAVAEDGTVSPNALQDIQIIAETSGVVASTLAEIGVNLDASDTDTHNQGLDIDPDDSGTYNYSMGFSIIDADGDTQNLAAFYQRLSSYTGNAPTGSSSVWKVSTFLNDDGTMSADPATGNTFFLHFDTDGHLVGSSSGTVATGDSYTSAAEVAASTSPVSDQLGETLTFTGSGSAQTISTWATVSFNGGSTAGETVTVGTDVFTLSTQASQAAAAAELTGLINQDSSLDYYAIDDGSGSVTIRTKSGAAAMDITSTASAATVDTDTSLSGIISAVNSGVGATGSIYLNLAGMTAGVSTVTVDGNTFTYGAANDFTTTSELNSLVSALSGVSSSTTGDCLYITASSAGSAGNSLGISTNDAANVVLSGSTLQNGVDGTTDSNVEASVTTGAGGQAALLLARDDVGASATITLSAANTLGANLGLDFNTYTQDSIASDGDATVEDQGEVALTFTFDKTDPDTGVITTLSQEITLDYSPDSSSASTQSAGSSETFFFAQDGIAQGYLDGLSVDDRGVISASYTNGQVEYVAAVALATFQASGELERRGDNLWMETVESGVATNVVAGDSASGAGTIESSALETSTVDLALEFVNMINFQRAFQANSKSITTADDMLQTAINMKT